MEYDYKQICSKIENEGYCLIDKFWDENIDNQINNFYQNSLVPLIKNTSIDILGNRNFALADDEITSNPFDSIKKSKKFTELCRNILRINNIKTNEDLDIHNVIALQKNEKNTNYKFSSKLHFDAFYLTIIIPIKKSDNTNKHNNGSLIFYPNLRKISSNSILNYITKFLIQNRIVRFILQNNYLKKLLNFKVVSSQQNKLLVFYGYRTLHGNEALQDGNLKVHSIFHVYNPHKNSLIDKWVFKRNKKIRGKKLTK